MTPRHSFVEPPAHAPDARFSARRGFVSDNSPLLQAC